MENKITPGLSQYITTCWMLSAKSTILFPDNNSIYFFSEEEANNLAMMVQKRNVFARHSRENNFYFQRVHELSNRTVISVFRPGDPKNIADEAEKLADIIEKLAVLSSTLALSKEKILRKLGISSTIRKEIDFIIGPQFRYLSSKSRPEPIPVGIQIDEKFEKRFTNCGFFELYNYCKTPSDLARRVTSSLDWLFESMKETRLSVSIVKSAIALETLLIFQESESLAQSLSERLAFILSPLPEERKLISKIIKRFYNARSGVVHGSRKKKKYLIPSLVEGVNRLTMLLLLVISANNKLWYSTESLREWCEAQKWGEPSANIVIPFSKNYLRNAIRLSRK